MEQVVALLTEIMFLLLLFSALIAGAWSFYNLIYKNRSLLNDDFFVLDLRRETNQGFELIEKRLETLEESHEATIEKITATLKILQNEQR